MKNSITKYKMKMLQKQAAQTGATKNENLCVNRNRNNSLYLSLW